MESIWSTLETQNSATDIYLSKQRTREATSMDDNSLILPITSNSEKNRNRHTRSRSQSNCFFESSPDPPVSFSVKSDLPELEKKMKSWVKIKTEKFVEVKNGSKTVGRSASTKRLANNVNLKSVQYDIVQVSFRLAELERGVILTKLKNFDCLNGKSRKYSIVVDKNGMILLKWISRSIFGTSNREEELLSIQVYDSKSYRFTIETMAGNIFVRASNNQTFKLLTEEMSMVFNYATHFHYKRKLDSRLGPLNDPNFCRKSFSTSNIYGL